MITDAEIETQRQQAIQEYEADHDDHPVAEATSGTLYAYEALHLCSFLLRGFDEQVMHNPAVLRDAESYCMAHQAHGLMFDLYQKLSREYFEAGDD